MLWLTFPLTLSAHLSLPLSRARETIDELIKFSCCFAWFCATFVQELWAHCLAEQLCVPSVCWVCVRVCACVRGTVGFRCRGKCNNCWLWRQQEAAVLRSGTTCLDFCRAPHTHYTHPTHYTTGGKGTHTHTQGIVVSPGYRVRTYLSTSICFHLSS